MLSGALNWFLQMGKIPRNGHMLQVVSADEFEVGPEDANAEVRDARFDAA